MTAVKTMKRGDLLPSLTATLRYRDPDVDLSAAVPLATPVVFTMRNRRAPASPPVIDRADAVLISSTAGAVTVRYDWAPGDTDTVGEYNAEFELDVGGEPLTAPTDGYLLVRIEGDLG